MANRPKSTIPRYKRRRQRSFGRRLLGWLVKLVLIFLIGSVLWVLAYRFVNPPITATMLGDLLAGRGAKRDWMSIEKIDRDMVRAAIGAEDSKFCSHNGFDVQAIEAAMIRNASGGRIRGGSTISQQTAKNAFLWRGGGYVRKGMEAWFTFLMEKLWTKRRITWLMRWPSRYDKLRKTVSAPRARTNKLAERTSDLARVWRGAALNRPTQPMRETPGNR